MKTLYFRNKQGKITGSVQVYWSKALNMWVSIPGAQ